MSVIDLKLNPQYFDPVARGLKTFEVRMDDRHYKVGDQLRLHAFGRPTDGPSVTSYLTEPRAGLFTPTDSVENSATLTAVVTYMLTYDDFPMALTPGWCVLAIRPDPQDVFEDVDPDGLEEQQ